MTDHPLIAAVGEALYGSRWQSEMARAIGVADRTMRRWVAGTHPVPAGVYAQLLELLRARRREFPQLARRLKHHSGHSSSGA